MGNGSPSPQQPHQVSQPVHHPAPAQHLAVPPTAGAKKTGSSKKPSSTVFWIVIGLVFVALIGITAFSYNKYQDSKKQVQALNNKLANPQDTAKAEQAQLIAAVGKITILPTGETPTIATVSDITKLKDQPFFLNAQNGDKVLIYTTAKKAFLYRPSTNKIINIAPVNIGDNSSSSTTTTTPTSSTTNK